MKKTAVLFTLIFVLVVFPLLNSGAFANLIGNGTLPMSLLSEPLNMLLFGAGLMAFGSSLRRIYKKDDTDDLELTRNSAYLVN